MTFKHIDLVAIGFLLLAAAVYSHVRQAVVLQRFGPARVILLQRQPRAPVFVLPKLPTFVFQRG